MISEGSCDSEDWSNDTENSALTSQEFITLLHIKIERNYVIICDFNYTALKSAYCYLILHLGTEFLNSS